MRRSTGILIAIAFLLAGTAFGQSVYTPEKGSPERKAILDALRVPVERELRQKIVFVLDNFNVSGNWAFLGGAPHTSEGSMPNYKGTEYAEAQDSGAFDNNIFALLRKKAGKWQLVTHRIGCTDVCYATWSKDFRAPKALFPYNY